MDFVVEISTFQKNSKVVSGVWDDLNVLSGTRGVLRDHSGPTTMDQGRFGRKNFDV